MRRRFPLVVLLLIFGLVGMMVWSVNHLSRMKKTAARKAVVMSQTAPQPLASGTSPLATEGLLTGYGDPAVPAIEDLRKLHHLIMGYFSLIKDPSRFPIGGNEDLTAALLGANSEGEKFIRSNNPILSANGQILDRWGTPLIVHPEGWRQLELRSAGADRIPYNQDDLILAPTGVEKPAN